MNTRTPYTVSRLASAMLLAAVATLANAKATPEQIAQLSKNLTPVGAERAGNKEGTIPAWTGGITKPPAGFDPSKGYLDPYAADKPLFTITAANSEQYKDKLAPGQLAMLKRNPAYKMVVYPTRRSAGSRDELYTAIANEAGKADLANNGDTLLNVSKSTVPFPFPVNGQEVVTNHTSRNLGGSVERYLAEFPVNSDGSFTPVRRVERYVSSGALENAPDDNTRSLFATTFTAPSNLAGQSVLVIDYFDLAKQERGAWVYSPGSRRVMRAPTVAYDTPADGMDGLVIVDENSGGFSGSLDRFDFKLVGKREMFISSNNYKLTDKSLKYKDIAKPGTLNQDLVRYELRRVWVVEGTLKAGKSHIYGKRAFYIDEDTWQIAEADAYDGRGELWRVLEVHAMQFYDGAVTLYSAITQYDFQARRYAVIGLTNEEKPYRFGVPYKVNDFSANALRRFGN